MPASDISRFSINGSSRSDLAATEAKKIAQTRIFLDIQAGRLSRNDPATIEKEYKIIYREEYYRCYAQLIQQDQQSRIIYVATDNPSAKKFCVRHAVATFSKSNCFIRVHRGCITVGRIIYPLDSDDSLETKEAFLTAWPGPLDLNHEKKRVTDYIDTLWQHDPQRRLRYCNVDNDDQRKLILKLLKELLHRNGSIDAPGITRLLLPEEQTEIQKDEGYRKPLETLQKYLLLGKRSEAIKFAKFRKLWDHAQCLSFLDKYQPPKTGSYVRDVANIKLRDDSIIKLNDEYISSVEHQVLNTVYRSLLNRILQSDPESISIVKHPNIANDPYGFALLSANDCEMEYDRKNELFKLISAIKQVIGNPSIAMSHLISLGYMTIDGNDPYEDLSYDRSHNSLKIGETYTSRTSTISNIDMLIFNEVWEYCLNLARGTCDPSNYEYIMDLVPYKIIFASRLLDLGLHGMFASYLYSIRNALSRLRTQPNIERDLFYDWDTIERSADHLSRIWEIFQETLPHQIPPNFESQFPAAQNSDFSFNTRPTYSMEPTHSLPVAPQNDPQPDYSENDYPSLPYQSVNKVMMNQNYPPMRQNIPPPLFSNQYQPIREEPITDFNPETEPSPRSNEEGPNNYEPLPPMSHGDNSNEQSRRSSTSRPLDVPVFSPPSFAPPGFATSSRNLKSMTSSSPVNKAKDQMHPEHNMADSFNSPYSPINEYDDLPTNRDSGTYHRSTAESKSAINNEQPTASGSNSASNINNKSSQPAGDQQSGLSRLFGAILPKSNSKHMILPDDSNKPMVYDQEKGKWIDTSQPEGADNNDQLDAPPVMDAPKQHTYSLATKSAKLRYPKAQF